MVLRGRFRAALARSEGAGPLVTSCSERVAGCEDADAGENRCPRIQDAHETFRNICLRGSEDDRMCNEREVLVRWPEPSGSRRPTGTKPHTDGGWEGLDMTQPTKLEDGKREVCQLGIVPVRYCTS